MGGDGGDVVLDPEPPVAGENQPFGHRLELEVHGRPGIPPHRITRLRRQGERYFADGLRELADNRRLAILAVCAVEWEMFLADAVVETHDRLVGRTYREAARACEAQLGDETAAVREALRAFAELGTALLGARDAGEALDAVIAGGPGWEGLGDLVAKAAALASTAVSDPLNHVLGGYSRFRRYTPRMLRTLDIEASPAAEPLMEAVDVLRSDGTARLTGAPVVASAGSMSTPVSSRTSRTGSSRRRT